jgi:hypothetical protein
MPYVIQGKPVTLATEPFVQNDKHYVSLREILEQVGGSVEFDNSTKVATATIAPWTETITMDDPAVPMASTANQQITVTLTAPPFVDNDEMYVPYDFFRDAFGYKVDFDNDTVSITNPNLPVG